MALANSLCQGWYIECVFASKLYLIDKDGSIDVTLLFQ